MPAEAEAAIEEISQRYNNMTVEDCKGFFHQGKEKEYKKITIWSQGIDSLWFNAIIARIKELSKLESIPIVSRWNHACYNNEKTTEKLVCVCL